MRREKLAIRARQQKEAKRLRLKERRERRARELAGGVVEASGTPGRAVTPSTSAAGTLLSGTAAHLAQFQNYITGNGNGKEQRMTREDCRLECGEEKEEEEGAVRGFGNRVLRRVGWMKPYSPPKERNGVGLSRVSTENSLVQDQNYKHFRDEIQREQDKEFRMKIGVSLSLFFSFWLVRYYRIYFLHLRFEGSGT